MKKNDDGQVGIDKFVIKKLREKVRPPPKMIPQAAAVPSTRTAGITEKPAAAAAMAPPINDLGLSKQAQAKSNFVIVITGCIHFMSAPTGKKIVQAAPTLLPIPPRLLALGIASMKKVFH